MPENTVPRVWLFHDAKIQLVLVCSHNIFQQECAFIFYNLTKFVNYFFYEHTSYFQQF